MTVAEKASEIQESLESRGIYPSNRMKQIRQREEEAVLLLKSLRTKHEFIGRLFEEFRERVQDLKTWEAALNTKEQQLVNHNSE